MDSFNNGSLSFSAMEAEISIKKRILLGLNSEWESSPGLSTEVIGAGFWFLGFDLTAVSLWFPSNRATILLSLFPNTSKALTTWLGDFLAVSLILFLLSFGVFAVLLVSDELTIAGVNLVIGIVNIPWLRAIYWYNSAPPYPWAETLMECLPISVFWVINPDLLVEFDLLFPDSKLTISTLAFGIGW